jgi:hypothetical protein
MTKQSNLNSEQLIFETIYQAAKEKNAEKIISLDCCVDIQYRGLGTPACVLAKEGNHEAVNFLKIKFNSLTCLVFLYQNQLEKFAPVVKLSVKDNLNSLGVW